MKPTLTRLASSFASARPESFIVASKRTPFGAYGGSLKDFKASELGGIASKAALAELPQGVEVDQVFFGNVTQSDNSTPFLARHVGHLAGLKPTVPALTLNRLCGSGFQAVITASQTIALGEAQVCLTGGAESMSGSPFTLSGATRFGTKYGVDLKLEDSLAAALVDQNPGGQKVAMGGVSTFPTCHTDAVTVTAKHFFGTTADMPVTAENLAKKYGISREDCDTYALQSQSRYAEGLTAGAFAGEITPVALKPSRKGPSSLEVDEHPRASTSIQSLGKLPPVFARDGVVTAGNASGICDGGAANVVMSEQALKDFGVKPLVRIASYAWSACEPDIMGIGPVVSVQQALGKIGKTVGDMDLIEVNEWLAVQKELELPDEKTNVFGGAIAVGHPLAASGARHVFPIGSIVILANLTHNLIRLDKQWALGAACIGGGQGIAVVLERC